jgi:hypothetical protein
MREVWQVVSDVFKEKEEIEKQKGSGLGFGDCHGPSDQTAQTGGLF